VILLGLVNWNTISSRENAISDGKQIRSISQSVSISDSLKPRIVRDIACILLLYFFPLKSRNAMTGL
jgi:hypothetical protein